MTTNVSYPKYVLRIALGANVKHPSGRLRKPAHIESAEIILGTLRAGDAHAALYELETLRNTLRKWTRDNPPKVELVEDFINIETTKTLTQESTQWDHYESNHRSRQGGELATERLASFEKELASLKNELQKSKKELSKAKAEIEKGNTPRNLDALRGKKHFLQMKLEAVENAHAEVLCAKDTLISLRNEELHEQQRSVFERMRGLLSYGFATGQTTPDCQLLFDSLGDYLEAKTDGDRKAAHRAVDLIFAHGSLGDPRDDETGAGDEVLRRFEAISDPEQRSAFYAKHKQEIAAAYDARKNNLS